ncbi:FAD-binding oxidoreductase [Catellatospora citrea]|uniref:FAD-binding protein n=1 Tax=Catellatospora citrea TaxID=53366 RepID=A0A8J3KMD9_9ACTN|nr:FAD-binding oxidoreductase [Catellatospora citrea]RKE08843.1 FAD/FMN-containing dehydrogenase [Catellatospora citrea]GIG02467.1 FAD-binding protein [Catellatospora citrea]
MARWRPTRRQVLTHGATAAGALAVGSAATLAVSDWAAEGAMAPGPPPGALLDDASRINPTAVRGVLYAAPAPDDTARVVGPLLRRITAGDDPALAVAGVRHSMGGQSMLAGGWVLDTRPMNQISLDSASRVVRVGAGATWRDLIPVLNAAGFSPKVMQSNHDFSVGGSLSVNCHGWHTDHPPIAATVRGLRLLTAAGEVVSCGPTENTELFGLVLGGYGLFGVILEADLDVWPNARYVPHFDSVPALDYVEEFTRLVLAPDSTAEMAYGRLSVDPRSFLEEAVIVRFTPEADTVGAVLPLAAPDASSLQRAVFRNSAGSSLGKMLRWTLEREAAPWLAGPISRNSIQNEPAAVFADHSAETSDILHEYFLPHATLAKFITAAREIIQRSGQELLNVTVRDVRRDTRSALAYAREDVFGLVMNFRQERTAEADARMRTLTRELIEAVLEVNGTYYLPYRLHATREQVRRAYPGWDAAMAAKSRMDPLPVFRNALFDAYA